MAELYTLRPRFFWVNFFSTIDSPNISGKEKSNGKAIPQNSRFHQVQDFLHFRVLLATFGDRWFSPSFMGFFPSS